LANVLNPRLRRILSGLSHDDLLWEVPGQPYFTQFNERTGKQARVHIDTLAQMEQMGLIRRHRQSESAHRLDFWEITAEGRETVQDRKTAASVASSRARKTA